MLIKKTKTPPVEKQKKVEEKAPPSKKEKESFNLDEINFEERKERRRGDRRRGYRRIDERNLISRAHQEAIAIKETARAEGYKEGLKEAEEDILVLRKSIEGFFDVKYQVYNELAPEILDISIDIARKIIKKEIETDKKLLINTIIEVLDGISKNEKKVTIKVATEDYDIAMTSIPEILSTVQTEAKITVVSDEKIVQGGALIETSNGIIDATFETQLAVVQEALNKI